MLHLNMHILNMSDSKFMPTSESILLGNLYSEKIILHAVVIYNIKTVLVLMEKMSPLTYSHGLPGVLCFVIRLC